MNDSGRATADVPQLRTLLLTDLCDSTRIVEKLGDARAAELFREHDRLVLQLQQRWRGRLIDRSDGLLLLFERPIDGLGFALDYERGLCELGTERQVVLTARAGLHVGEVLTWRNSDEAVRVGAKPLEVEGLAKPFAARLMAMARPGQILLSAIAEPLAYRAARELGPRGERLVWKSHGRWVFKGLPGTQEIFEVGEPGIAPLRTPKHSPKAWRAIPLWRRPAALVAELALLAGIAAGTWFALRPQPAIAFGERDWVVVGDLRNLTGQKVLDDSLEQAFRISLEQSRHVNVLSELKARDTLERMRRAPETALDRELASEVALRDGARAVILPTVAEVGGRVRVSAEVIDPHTQTTVYTHFADGPGAASLLGSIDTVTAQLRRDLGEALESIEQDSEPLPRVTTRNLDALRAYALGQKATGARQWEQAEGFYRNAIELDPNFALAHMGLARLRWSSIDYRSALPHLERALALRDSLPPRDRLYLDAWRAETAERGTPLEEWQRLASMYPDYFAGTSNASWYLLVGNRFREALPHAEAAAVPQDPLRAFPLDHLGRIHLALGDAGLALRMFEQAERAGGGRPIRYRADALAVLGRHEQAQAVLDSIRSTPDNPVTLYAHLERISLALDRRQPEAARRAAHAAVRDAVRAGPEFEQHFRLAELLTRVAIDPRTLERAPLERLAAALQARLRQPELPARATALFQFLTVAYAAQRAGHAPLAARLLAQARPMVAALDNDHVARMLALVEANQRHAEGDTAQAIAMLRRQLDGREFVQARVALMRMLGDAGRGGEAIEHRRWLAANLGRAYVEINADQVLQPLNVADARAAIVARAGNGAPAR